MRSVICLVLRATCFSKYKSIAFCSCLPYKAMTVCPKRHPLVFEIVRKYRSKSTGPVHDSFPSKLKENQTVQGLFSQKVKENIVAVGCIGVPLTLTGLILYDAFITEPFITPFPYTIYSEALQICCTHSSVIASLGLPVIGCKEPTFRRRIALLRCVVLKKDGRNHLFMKFYLKGSRKSGTVRLEMVEESPGIYDKHPKASEEIQTLLPNEASKDVHTKHKSHKCCQSKPECGRQTLQELLIRPVQCLPSVILLLNDILKHTPKNCADYQALEKAIQSLKDVLLHINEDKRKTEGQVEMFDIVNDIENCPEEKSIYSYKYLYVDVDNSSERIYIIKDNHQSSWYNTFFSFFTEDTSNQ